ncbi:hypothetical protein ACFPK9_01150 [Rubritalea spongiae]|uniref:Uncharacterized protein n=1 Tax=Rubritalea spongiae TaxID=430797 RepID=A0ABW5DZJ0_9BACT
MKYINLQGELINLANACRIKKEDKEIVVYWPSIASSERAVKNLHRIFRYPSEEDCNTDWERITQTTGSNGSAGTF